MQMGLCPLSPGRSIRQQAEKIRRMGSLQHTVNVIDQAVCPESPRRLCAETRRLAARGLSGEFGRALQHADPALKEMLPSGDIEPDVRYAAAVALIAESAPLRILPEERIVGAATYREAAGHAVPILEIDSTSHLTPGFDRVLSVGYAGLRASIRERLARGGLDGKGVSLLTAMLACLDAAGVWHRRYLEALEQRIAESHGAQKAHYKRVIENARNVPEHPPRTFCEAVQSLWFLFAFQRLCGNWPGIGRIDQMLGPCLEQELLAGTITLDEARELLASTTTQHSCAECRCATGCSGQPASVHLAGRSSGGHTARPPPTGSGRGTSWPRISRRLPAPTRRTRWP